MLAPNSVRTVQLMIVETITCPLPEWIALKSNDHLSLLFSDRFRHGLTRSRQARGFRYRQDMVTFHPLSSVAQTLITVMAPYFVNSVFAFCTIGGGCIDNACVTVLDASFQ